MYISAYTNALTKKRKKLRKFVVVAQILTVTILKIRIIEDQTIIQIKQLSRLNDLRSLPIRKPFCYVFKTIY